MRKIKIGLALGSGAARGWSHIGVIKALKHMGIDVDIVAGCSIGSLVGAAYACNKLPALEKWVCSFSYWDVLRLMDLSWRRGGLLRGERVFNQYRNVMPVEAIEQCTRRFATVATNLSTGRELWFTEGDLHLAVRASCSIPGLMSPVAHNGYWLVDGAVVNPVPVSLARALGADIVIAVDLQHDAHLMQQDLIIRIRLQAGNEITEFQVVNGQAAEHIQAEAAIQIGSMGRQAAIFTTGHGGIDGSGEGDNLHFVNRVGRPDGRCGDQGNKQTEQAFQHELLRVGEQSIR